MRGWVAAVAVGGAVAVMLAGCSLPDGVDGDVANDWPAFGEPVAFIPEPEVCHERGYQQVGVLDRYQPVECTRPHLAETVHVGAFSGDAAELDEPPELGSAELREAYQECDTEAAEYLGGDFRTGWLWLGVTSPSGPAWAGGARWFRCEVVELADGGDDARRTGSLKEALADGSELRLGCFTVSDGDNRWVNGMTPVDCGKAHQAEFVGVWRAPDGRYPDGDDDKAWQQVHRGCRERVAKYVDVPNDGALEYRTGTIADWMTEEDWQAGDRGFRCYLWLPDEKLTKSLKGAGTKALPVN